VTPTVVDLMVTRRMTCSCTTADGAMVRDDRNGAAVFARGLFVLVPRTGYHLNLNGE
jgi:hypothetical protein